MPREPHAAVSRLDHDDPQVRAYKTAEERAYEQYGLDFTDHRIEVPELDLRIRAVEVGTGPPIVLIPGGEGPGITWLPLLPELQEYTVYVMDRPGGGLSDGIDHRSLPLRREAVASTAALFDYLEFDAVPVIGNSMGGLWSLRFALEHPERLSAIALPGCPALYPGTSAPFPMRLPTLPGIGGFIVENFMQSDDPDGARETWEFLGHPSETIARLPDELAEAWYRSENLPHFEQSWVSLLKRAVRLRGAQPEAAFTRDDLRAIRSPVSLIWGSEDPFGSVDTGQDHAEHFPEAEFHEVGVGHLPWLDEPEACGELLREFLARHA